MVKFIYNSDIDYKKRKTRARSIMLRLKKNITVSELRFKKLLDEMGIKYQFQKRIFTKEKFYIADFYLKKSKIVVEIDGGIHNDRFEQDKNREIEILKTRKIKFIVRFDNEIINNNIELVKTNINDIINKNGEFYNGLIKRKSDILNKISKEKEINKLSCGQINEDWKYGRTISFNDIYLNEKEKNEIMSGKTIIKGKWKFFPIYK